ncbi:MAG TPA: CAP domain-containing protein [Acidobacteriota bacterium]|nr:CAP domain-containing protein [Acidobacteriota bacterium]
MAPVPLAAEELQRLEQLVQQNVNHERISKHIPQLDWNERLAAEARRHAENICNRRFFAHEDPVRGNVDRRLDASGIRWQRCAENIYAGAFNGLVDEAVAAWRLSPEHRKIMLDSMLSEAGVGIAIRRDGTMIVVQEFILE